MTSSFFVPIASIVRRPAATSACLLLLMAARLDIPGPHRDNQPNDNEEAAQIIPRCGLGVEEDEGGHGGALGLDGGLGRDEP